MPSGCLLELAMVEDEMRLLDNNLDDTQISLVSTIMPAIVFLANDDHQRSIRGDLESTTTTLCALSTSAVRFCSPVALCSLWLAALLGPIRAHGKPVFANTADRGGWQRRATLTDALLIGANQ